MTDGPSPAGGTEPTFEDRLPAIAPALRAAARRHGTPLYLTDAVTLGAAAEAVRSAFADPWIRQYSLKANDVPGLVRRIGALGFGANVVSRGEWAVARAAGLANGEISLEGVGKTDADLRAAVTAARDGRPLRWIAIESADEAEALAAIAARIAARAGQPFTLDVLARLNPDVSPETHHGLAVGRGGSKFGMTETELSGVVERLAGDAVLRPRGIHLHVGSQLGAVDAWRDGVRRALALLALLRGGLADFDTLDVGGGFPVGRLGQPVPTPARFAREIRALLEAIPPERRPDRLAVEPGRAIVARAGWIVARVLHVRDRDGRLVVLDAGMTELIRPALYGATHPIVALTSLGRPVDHAGGPPGPSPADTAADVHGPICESTDTLGQHALPPLRRGDLVAIRDAGAYAASMASTYNGRPAPAQVVLEPDGRLVSVRRRGALR